MTDDIDDGGDAGSNPKDAQKNAGGHPAAAPDKMRLNRWFSDQGLCSRREADRWITAGRVTVNGGPAELGTQVGPADRIAVDGRAVSARARPPVVIAYNKPIGVECTSDPNVPENIITAVGYPERLVHVGRLDQMSEGLILLTNRGDLVNRILRSENEHEKEYMVDLAEPITDVDIQRLVRGIDIEDGRGKTRPCRIARINGTRIRIILTEGRNRQIRRMLEVIGNHVKRLERVRIMHVHLGALPRGAWRHLSDIEMRDLFAALGLEKPKRQSRTELPRAPSPRPPPPRATASRTPAPAPSRGPSPSFAAPPAKRTPPARRRG